MNFQKKLIKRICLQLLIRGNRPWNGRESHYIVTLSHEALNATTNEEDFRRLVSAVFQVGKAIDFSYKKQTYQMLDWESFRVRISEIMGDLSYSSGFDFFVNRLRGRIASCSLESRTVFDWVEVINSMLNEHDIVFEDFNLEEKLEISKVLDEYLDIRLEVKASCAAYDMGISIEKLVDSLMECLSKVELLPFDERVIERTDDREQSDLECLKEIILLSDARSASEIMNNLKKYPGKVSKVILRRRKACQENFIVERLWSKGITGSSGLFREMVIVCMGVHYRLLYKTNRNCNHPFLAFGPRRDLQSMVEKVKSFIL